MQMCWLLLLLALLLLIQMMMKIIVIPGLEPLREVCATSQFPLVKLIYILLSSELDGCRRLQLPVFTFELEMQFLSDLSARRIENRLIEEVGREDRKNKELMSDRHEHLVVQKEDREEGLGHHDSSREETHMSRCNRSIFQSCVLVEGLRSSSKGTEVEEHQLK